MPLRFLFDEDTLDKALWNAIQQHNASSPADVLDVLRIGDPGTPPTGALDTEIVLWAIDAKRVIISRDTRTLIVHHATCVQNGYTTPGLLIIKKGYTIPEIVESLVLLSYCEDPDKLSSCHNYIPLT